jgi:hypothetical protein
MIASLGNWFVRLLGPTASADSGRTQDRFYAVFFMLLVILGLALPEHLLARHSSLRAFCDFIASIVPQIDRIAGLGIRVDENVLYYSLLWAFSVPFFVIFYISTRRNFVRRLI